MKVMVVDDSKAMRMIITRTLRQAGFVGTVVEASNGAEAFEILQTNVPDLVLCDWNMPVMSGIELVEKINQSAMMVKLGFVTSESTPAMRARAAQAGALFLLAKPFTSDAFEEILKLVAA
jgi:two-component system chemotaxis response regulator CheY